jgi:hypothetical protein
VRERASVSCGSPCEIQAVCVHAVYVYEVSHRDNSRGRAMAKSNFVNAIHYFEEVRPNCVFYVDSSPCEIRHICTVCILQEGVSMYVDTPPTPEDTSYLYTPMPIHWPPVYPAVGNSCYLPLCPEGWFPYLPIHAH